MKNILLVTFSLLLSFSFIQSCKKDHTEASAPTPFSLNVPAYFPEPVIPNFNPLTVEGVRLGRMLYYDPILSSNGLSCSSCHIRNKSFSSPLFSTVSGENKSVPPHVNLAWNPEYNWNGSEPVLDHLCLGDFGPEFYNTNMNELVQRLKNHARYPSLFYEAFNLSDVGSVSHDELKLQIVYSITQFMRTMVSANSKFDKMARHEVQLSASEMNGYSIFMTEKGDCFHCHGTILFTTNQIRNNGLDSILTSSNMGYYQVTSNPNDKGKFSTPTLRNVELTAPYMHDGRFQTLEEVIDFYDSGVSQHSPNIDPIMTKTAKRYGLQLHPYEKQDLINFLKTLTDTSFIQNPDFANPF